MLLRGHCLVWHGQTPEFFFHVDYDEKKDYATKEVMTKRLESYIRQVLTFCKENYPGLIYAWDVVNEAIHDDGNPRNEETSNWYRIYQDTSYINEAFAYAKKYAEEGTSLFYNDYEEYAPDKLAGIYKKVKELYAEGNIDGVGMQSHYIMDYPSVELVEEAIDKYNSIAPGEIEIQLTELDIHNTDNSEESQDELAKRYVDFFKMLVAKKKAGVNITNVTVWGLDDETTWLTGFRKEKSYPLLFDKDYNEKKSFKELIKLSKEL